MKDTRSNREAISTIGDLVEVLYQEINFMPISDEAKTALVTVMMGDILKQSGKNVYMISSPEMILADHAA